MRGTRWMRVGVTALAAATVAVGLAGAADARSGYRKTTYHLSDYLPLDRDNAWTFETIVQSRGRVLERAEDTWVVTGRERVHGPTCCARMATEVEMSDVNPFTPTGRPPRLFLSLSESGLTLYGHDLPGLRHTPTLRLPAVVKIGEDNEEYTTIVGPIRTDGTRGQEKARPWHCEITVESCDRVIVPAGAFNDCLQLSVVVRQRDGESPSAMDWRVWLAKDIGPIASVLRCEGYPAASGPVTVQEELVRATVRDLHVGEPAE